jgi:hypothetical protein
MSSHFTTQAAMLIWARTGAYDIAAVRFLDWELIQGGTIECTFLLRPLNRTNALEPARAHERWIHHTRLLLEGLSHVNSTSGKPVEQLVAEEVAWRVRLEDMLPTVPDGVVVKETSRWMGVFVADRLWPGECVAVADKDRPGYVAGVVAGVGSREEVAGYMLELGNLINWGAEQSNYHPNQAIRCWNMAADLMKAVKTILKNTPKFDSNRQFMKEIREYSEVLESNLVALSEREMYPYSLSDQKLRAILLRNFGRKEKRKW